MNSPTTGSPLRRVAVIGGGITGLAACLRLQELAAERRERLQLHLIEAGPRLGGVISTLPWEGCLLEGGPDAIFTEKPWGLEFLRKLGLEDDLIGTNPAHRRSFIARGRKLFPVPEGFYLIAPSSLWAFARTPIFSWAGKLRMLRDLWAPARVSGEDESLASFVRRRLGEEALERMAQPMIAGIYSADPEELSLRSTFPRFLDWEREHGSVIRGLRATRARHRHSQTRGPRYGLFVSLRGGLEQLVEAAAARIPRESIFLETPVRSVRKEGSVFRVAGHELDLSADGVCLALPAYAAAALTKELDAAWSRELGAIPYLGSITVNLVYDRDALGALPDGFGFVIPASERRTVSGCTFTSTKFEARAPDEDTAVVRAYIGGATADRWMERSDLDVIEETRKDLEWALGWTAPHRGTVVTRHPRSMPQYRVGHLDLLERIEAGEKKWPGLAAAGNAYRGVGIPDCIKSGRDAAERIFAAF